MKILPCLDSDTMAAERRRELAIPRHVARELGESALEAIRAGRYLRSDGAVTIWRDAVAAAVKAKVSIPPTAELPPTSIGRVQTTQVQVTNETTMGAARRLLDAGHRPLALNFANGIRPGGGFLGGARAQEEALCRASALFATLEGDPMYDAHQQRARPDSTDWMILSPDVPVFRTDDGTALDEPWPLSVITSAAPVAYLIGQPEARDLLQRRMRRLFAVARAYGYETLILGAWGCGAFGNDTERTARDFRSLLEGEFAGVFREVVFAITDWSPERKFLGPFRDVMSGG